MNAFDIEPLYARVLQLAWPISLQALAGASFGLLDVAMVQSLGPAALAAVGFAGRLLFFFTMMLMGLAGGAAVLMAQYAGLGDAHSGGRIARWLALIGLAFTLPLAGVLLAAPLAVAQALVDDAALAAALADYLQAVSPSLPLAALIAALSAAARSYGDTRSALVAGIAALVLNGVLNAVLIFGLFGLPAWGVAGAGVATSLARGAELLMLVALLARRRGWFAAFLAGFTAPRWAVPRLAGVALPFMAQEAAWAGGLLVLSMLFAAMGTQALAITTLLAPVEGLLIDLFVGGAVACGIVVGQLLGQGRYAVAQALARHCLQRFVLVALPVCMVGGGIASMVVARLDWLGEARTDAVLATLLVALLTLLRVSSMTLLLGVLRAGGDQRGVIGTDLVVWTLTLPVAAAGALHWGWSVPQVYALLVAAEAGKALMLGLRMGHGVWLRRLVPTPDGRRPAAAAQTAAIQRG